MFRIEIHKSEANKPIYRRFPKVWNKIWIFGMIFGIKSNLIQFNPIQK